MQALTKFVNWMLRLMGYALGLLVILAVGAIAIFGFTSFGARIVTEKVASIVSNRDMTIAIREPEGLLTGGLRAAEITVSDTRGVFAEISGLSINWNPLALLTGTFHAKSVEVASINVLRKPVRTLPSQREASSGFSLPLKVDIDKISIPDIKLAQQLTGRAFALVAVGSLQANSEGGDAVININRHDVPDAKLSADIAFLPDQNQLRVKALLAEPKGGLLAGFLALPGNPAVSIDLSGEGPISDWRGKLQAALDGQQRAAIETHHTLTADNLHHLDLKGGGDLSSLLPAAFRQLFSGQTNIDVSATFNNKGKIDIQTGNVATGSVVIAASGTLDPAGNNSLNANILGTSGPVDFRWPLADGEARFMISGLNLALTGDAKAARLNASASLDSAMLPQATIGNVKLTAKSDKFNLANRAGDIQVRLVAGDTSFVNPDINRAVQGPVTLATPLQISRDAIGFNATTLESASIRGNLNGSYKLSNNALTGNVKLAVQPDALPPAIAGRFDAPIAIESQVAGTIPSKINLSNLAIRSGTIEAAGNVALDGETLNATLSGRLANVQELLENAAGEANYALSAKGDLSALAITANLKAANLNMAGRTVGNLDVNLSGTADPAAPQGRVDAKGTIDGQPISINTDVQFRNGKTSFPSIVADVGSNQLKGSVELSPAFEPTGALTFDFPDISLLAALGGQKAEGDLKGSLTIANDAGKIGLNIAASGSGLHRDAFSLVKPDIHVTVSDLKAFAASGAIKADEIGSGTNKLAGLAVNFTQQQNRTNFDLNAVYDDNPLMAAGNVEASAGNMTLQLERFSAKPRNIPVELAAPTQVTVSNGVAVLNGLTIRTGNGSVSVTGSAGETLKIDADIADLPASLANSFMPQLEADGTISGTASVTGTPAAPIADFKLNWKNAATSQTKGANLSPLAITADGKFADNKLDFSTDIDGKGGVSLKASGNFVTAGPDAQSLKVDADILNIPASLANSFVPNLAVEGSVSGTVAASGKLPAPIVDFKLGWKNAATSQTKSAKLSSLAVNASGKLANNNLDFDALASGSGGLSLKAAGNFVVAGPDAQTLKVDGDIVNVPAALANAFVPDLAAEGTISGTVSASGKLPAPAADFKLNWKNAATSQTKSGGLSGLNLNASGKFADNKLDFDTDLEGKSGLSLKAAGNIALAGATVQSLKVDANLAGLPASLANSFVPNLAAEGTISGTASASGTLQQPEAVFDLNWKDAATSQTKAAKLSTLAATAKGKFANNRLDFDTNVDGGNATALKASGTVAIEGTKVQNLKVDASLSNFPAGLVNGFVPNLAAEGLISGTASAAGTLPAPAVDFKLDWKNAATRQTKAAGLSALSFNAAGKFADDKVDFDANLSGDGGVLLKATGGVALQGTNIQSLKVDADIANLPASLANGFVPSLGAEGIISGTAATSGTPSNPIVDFKLDWKNAATSQTKSGGLSGLNLNASGKFADNKLDFDTDLEGKSGLSLKASGNIALAGATVQSLKVDANLAGLPASLANSFVPNLAAEGTISGTASASGTLQQPEAVFDLNWKDAATSQTKAAKLSTLAATAKGKFANNRLDFDTNVDGGNATALKASGTVAIEGTKVQNLKVDASLSNFPAGLVNGFVPNLAAEGLISGTASAAGTLPAPAVDFKLDWKNAATRQTKAAGLSALSFNAAGKFADDKVDFDANLSGDGGVLLKATGGVALQGTNIQSLKVDADIANLPASLANGFVPSLGAEGIISGTAATSGTPSNPIVDFKLDWKNAATSQTKAAGAGALGATASGKLANNRLDFNANLSGNNISLKAGGNFVVAGPDAQSLNVNADITNLPAGLANAFVPGLAAEGNISGTVAASGRLPTPNVDFRLNWKNAATSQTKGAGLSPFGITANGKLANNNLTIDTNLVGDKGLSLKGGGSVGIAGNRALNLRFTGNLPFAVLGAQLAAQGLVADGTANFNLQISGTAAAPVINGTITTDGAKIVDVRRNLALNNVVANITLNGQQAVISRLNGQLASGGRISVTGTVGIQPAGGFPVDITVKLDKAVYVDGTLVVATVDGTLGLRGPLLSNPALSGKLQLEKASITVPDRLPTSLREVDIRHVNAPAAVRAQLRDNESKKPSEKSSSISLDLQLDAPSQIYVRGRGIDAELGGSVTIKGTAATPVVSGGFTMRRGRLTILNRRLNFTDKSRITFAGDLTPALDMEASSTVGSTTLTVDVAGLVTDPAITFSSSPALPQDEVLAQLIFGQSMSKLSPVQIAQLADAVSQLSGGHSTSLFEGLRNQLGVDDLDISTDEKGQTSVSVGRYLNERTYFELQQGGAAGAKAIINLDVGRGVKLRGAAGGNGAGEAGIVYEHEY